MLGLELLLDAGGITDQPTRGRAPPAKRDSLALELQPRIECESLRFKRLTALGALICRPGPLCRIVGLIAMLWTPVVDRSSVVDTSTKVSQGKP